MTTRTWTKITKMSNVMKFLPFVWILISLIFCEKNENILNDI